jgi:signal transduction histidine kinase
VSRRILAGYLSLALVVLIALEVPLAVTFRRSEQADLGAKVERDAVAVASLVEDILQSSAGATAPLDRLATRYGANTGGRVVVVDRQGVSLVDQGAPVGRDLSTRPEIAAALRGTVASGTRYSQTLGHGLLYVAVPVSSGGDVYGAVRITYPTSEIDHRVYRYWLTLAAIGAIILVLTALVGVVLARWVARPLSALERTARRAGEGDLTVRADETRGPPEVRELAAELNVMVREVEQMVAAQRDFVADASHQLRTPLTALRLRLENLAHDVPADGKRQLEGATVETERLARIVDGLLVLARAETPSTSLEPIGLEPLVKARVDSWTSFANERGLSLVACVPTDVRVVATAERLEQVLDNLLANALEVAPSGSAVELEWSDGALHVLDRGLGMTDEELRHAFDRFWRARSSEGSGLGLAIVRRLVEADGGSIVLQRRAGGGIDAVITLRGATARHRDGAVQRLPLPG